jgi:sialate O-acetylesterase
MLILSGIFSPTAIAAGIRLGSPFVDHMVLQRGKPLEVWGTADANSQLTLQIADQQAQATAAADGAWHVQLKPMPAGGPYDLTVTAGAATATIHDLLIGDVWLCSGQSNMQFSVGECDDAAAVMSVPHPKLRLGRVGQAWTKTPQSTAKIKWTNADTAITEHFSAVAYDFAHELEKDPAMRDVPIGMLEDCLGATVIESWLPQSALADFDPKKLQSSMFGIGPTQLYNGMIAPLGHSTFTGVIWYQGEGNAGEPEQYAKYLPLLFKTWRDQFQDPTLPMLVVQLPDYAPDWGTVYWEWIRDAEATAVAATPNSAYVVTINTNDGWNLHPQGKHEIGRRLSLLARQEVYKENVVGCGPVFKSARVQGSKIIATFDAGDHLTAGAGPVDGFMIAGQDGVYHAADAVINGDNVIVSCPDVHEPKTIRYAWIGVPYSTLTNSSRIPAAPFRTDNEPVARGQGEVQRSPVGYTFKGKEYQVMVSADGVLMSLVLRNQQLLSNAADPWGGARVAKRSLSQMKMINPQQLVCSNNETSLIIDFDDTKMRWTLVNKHQKEPALLQIALASSVSVNPGDSGLQTIRRKNASADFVGIDTVTAFKDAAADDGTVLETTVPAGQTKSIEIDMSSH